MAQLFFMDDTLEPYQTLHMYRDASTIGFEVFLNYWLIHHITVGEVFMIWEHPFNLKGVSMESIFVFASRHYFFLQKYFFYKA